MALQHFVGQSQELALAAATAVTAEEREERQKEVRAQWRCIPNSCSSGWSPGRGGCPASAATAAAATTSRAGCALCCSLLPRPRVSGPSSTPPLQAEKLDEKLRFIVEKIPDRQYHVMGSNAGAGSGEFHMYRAVSRRRCRACSLPPSFSHEV